LLGVSDGACHDLLEPSAATRNGADQSKASLDRIVAIRSPGVLLAPSPHSNAHLAEECQSILSKMIALLLYQLAGKISISTKAF